MGNKGAILNGLLEKVVLKTLSKLTYDSGGNLRVINTPNGTQAVSGTVTATVASTTAIVAGNSTVGSTQAFAQMAFQQSFRRNLNVT